LPPTTLDHRVSLIQQRADGTHFRPLFLHTGSRDGIRAARPSDVDRCVSLANRRHVSGVLFRPYTVDFLAGRLEAGSLRPRAPAYGLDDFYVSETGFKLRRAQQFRTSKD
jgi:hypothetical protein